MNRKTNTVLLAILIFYALALPLILMDYNAGRASVDQHFGHLPTIMGFVEQLDFSKYSSATTPGYHVFLAFFAKFISPNAVFLKLISSLFTAVLIGLLAHFLYEKAGRTKTIVLLLPLIFSLYILPNGVWIVPDNLAWLTVGIIFFLAVTCPLSLHYFIWTGITLFIAVAVRQSNLWLASVPWATGVSYMLFYNNSHKKKIAYACLSFLITVPAFLLLLYFINIWGGLVPPTGKLQGRHEGSMSFCVPAFFLTIFLVYSTFYLPITFQALKKIANRSTYYYLAAGFCIGFLAAIIPATDFSPEGGRFSGFWNFVKLAPDIGHTSTLLTITSSLGGVVFLSWLLLLRQEMQLILLLSSLAFILAHIPNGIVLERYFAGFTFILIFVILYSTDKIKWTELPRKAFIGPVLFAIINLLFLCRGIFPGLM